MDCIFCKIATKEVPSFLLYEDNDIIAVLDIYPANPGHTLIFPKQHIETYDKLPDSIIGKMFTLAKYLMIILKNTINAKGFNIYIASGEVAGQRVPHIVLHLIPRFENDQLSFEWTRKQVNPQFLQQLQATISQAIANFNPQQQQPINSTVGRVIQKENPKEPTSQKKVAKKEEKKDYSKMLQWFYRKI